VNETLLTLAVGTADVWFAGISIRDARGHGAALTGTRGIAFLNVSFQNLGQDAINTYQSNDTLVAGALIEDVGCGGVRFQGGGDRITLTPSGNALVDSVVTRAERLCFTYNPAVDLDTGAVAAHNDLSDMPHFAITLSGVNVLVQGNLVHNVSARTFDSAAIYFYLTDYSMRNTTIRYNFLYNNGQDPTTCNSVTSCNRDAIYPDNGTADVNITSNIIFHPRPAGSDMACPHCQPTSHIVSYAIFEDGTRECVKTNNIIVLDDALGGASNMSFNGGAGVTWDKAQQGNQSIYISELHEVRWNTSIYAAAFPALARLHDWWPLGGALACAADPDCGPAPYGFELTRNVIVGAATIFSPPPAPFYFPAMALIENNLETLDPGWEVPDPRAALNFQLAATSPAYALGFQRIPTECFGVGKRCPGEADWAAREHALARGGG
jgi:hypothetical protein